MTDPEFLEKAEAVLRAVEASCDALIEIEGIDLDNQRTGGMVTLTFANRSQIVINLQKPLHEVWMAAKSGGYHYRWKDGMWKDTKGQGEFFDALTKNATAQSGQSMVFRP